MKYQALYRKYRPLTFDDVFGQDAIVRTLKNSIKNNKFSHAYLFCGPRGTGKTSIAKIFAKAMNCENNMDGNPCKECFSCKQIDNKLTSDIIEIDAASNNGVDEIREIRNKVNLVPSECRYKIYIIDEVHMLSMGAFNALLKTLEEPPAHIIFILATTEPHKVPQTIISRCQRFDFKKIEQNKIEEKIRKIISFENIKIADQAIAEIARLSDGGLRDAESLLEKLISFSNGEINELDVHMINGTVSNQRLLELLSNLLNGSIDKVLDYINEFSNDGKDLIRLVEDMIIFLRDYLIYMVIPDYFSNNQNLKRFYSEIKVEITKDKIYELIKNLNIANNEMRLSNNQKILFELALLNYSFNEPIPSKTNKNSNKVDSENNLKEKDNINLTKNVDYNEILNLKNVRINNTLVLANKEILNIVINNWNELKSYTIDQEYGLAAGILIDSIPRAAGDNSILITYPYDSMAERANENLEKLESLLNKIFNKKYKLIAISESEWQKVKAEYIIKKKNGEKYEIILEENIPIKQTKSDKKGKRNDEEIVKTAMDLFGDNIIEVK